MAGTVANIGIARSARPIAHRRSGDDARHALEEHLRAAALLAGEFAEAWGASEAAALAALWHDLGKYASDFQEMIHSAEPAAHLENVPGIPGNGLTIPAPARSWQWSASVPDLAACLRIQSQDITPAFRIGSARARELVLRIGSQKNLIWSARERGSRRATFSMLHRHLRRFRTVRTAGYGCGCSRRHYSTPISSMQKHSSTRAFRLRERTGRL